MPIEKVNKVPSKPGGMSLAGTELLPHFSRPKVSFLGDMIYGLMAGGDVKLSSICRAYRPRMALADHIPVVRVAVDERVAAPRLLGALHPCRRMSS